MPLNGTEPSKKHFFFVFISRSIFIAGCLLDKEMPEGVQRTVVAAGPRVPSSRAVTVEGAPGLRALPSVLAEVRETSGRHGRESENKQSLNYWTSATLENQKCPIKDNG